MGIEQGTKCEADNAIVGMNGDLKDMAEIFSEELEFKLLEQSTDTDKE